MMNVVKAVQMKVAPGFVLAGVVAVGAVVAPVGVAAQEPPGIVTYHVQGNVYMLVGAGGNVAVQVGEDGVLVVDPGIESTGEQVLAAIRELSDRPIRWMVNTHMHPDHTGANERISQAGQTLNGNPAAIIAHENTLLRMTRAGVPITARPLNSFFEAQRDFYFNGEAVFIYHEPAGAHTDGDAFVYFRGSDVLVAGDLFVTTTFPVIDLENGGGIQGFIDALNVMLDIAVPAWLQEGGTYVIPGHGRVADEADVVHYRDMVLFVRDRVQHLVDQGMTLEQVQAARPSLDYDPRYGSVPGWTTEQFIEAVYRDLSARSRAGNGSNR